MKVFKYVSGLPVLQSLETQEINGKRHYLLPTGKYVPSVTTVLGHAKQASLQGWRDRVGHEEASRITNRAATRGTKFHNMLERYLSNAPKVLDESIMPDMRQAFRDMQASLDRIDNIHYIETPLYSESLGLAGRTDVIGEFDGVLSVIDFKTSKRQKHEGMIQDYFLQGTAYAMMYEERVGIRIDQIVVLMSTDGLNEPQIFIKDKNQYIGKLMDRIRNYSLDTADVV